MTDIRQYDGRQKLVFVTGPSGAGRQTAVKCLEDIGFEAIDNLPLSLWSRLLRGPAPQRPLALGIDVRNRDFSVDRLLAEIGALDDRTELDTDLLYMDCSAEVLLRRYSETRRPHPLGDIEPPDQAIAREIDLLAPIRGRADVLIDTSDLTPHDLRAEIERWFGVPGTTRMSISVQSFSYKRGVPRGVDMVFDVRFLRNPHWEKDLKALTGLDERVSRYVNDDPRFGAFRDRLAEMILSLLPAFREEGKSSLTIAIGCTGGQHRSVAVAENLAKALEEANWQVSKRHRELERRREFGDVGSSSNGDRA